MKVLKPHSLLLPRVLRLDPGRPLPRAVPAAPGPLDEGGGEGDLAVRDLLHPEGLAVVEGPPEAAEVVALVAPVAEAEAARTDLGERMKVCRKWTSLGIDNNKCSIKRFMFCI